MSKKILEGRGLSDEQIKKILKSDEYWKQRFAQIENSANKSAVETLSFIDDQYKDAVKEIEYQISTWYARFAKNNEISIQEARKWLLASELKELKWDIKEYIKYGHENDLNAGWVKELENASAKFHISRLEALKLQMQMTCERLFGNQLDMVDGLLKSTYLDGYYHSAYEIQRGLNIGWDIAAIDEATLSKVMNKPWTTDGKNFSDRIWSNRSSLISEVHKQLTQNLLLGRSPDASIKAISKKFNASKNQAGRLVMTESAYFISQSQKDCFNELGVEKFEVVETLDTTTCALCASMDGQVFDMKDFEPGITAPPFHPWCRGCNIPYFDDNFSERAARDKDGKTYYVPSDMKFKDWKNSFVDNEEKVKDGLKVIQKADIIKSLDIDDFNMMAEAKGIDHKVSQIISSVIERYEQDNSIYISDFCIDSLSSSTLGTTLMQIEPIADSTIRLNINRDVFEGCSLEVMDEKIANTDKIIAKNLEEAVIHECGHAKSIKGRSIQEIRSMYEELSNVHITGISTTAYDDGAEALAEMEVLISRGEKLSEEAQLLYDKYMKR